jgi:uncharacterized protein YkwD
MDTRPIDPRSAARVAATLVVLAALLLTLVPATPASAAIDSSLEHRAIELVNEDRAARGLPRLTPRSDLMETARAWSRQLAKDGKLSHNPALRTDVCCWNVVGENVGTGASIEVIHRAFLGSEGHRRNIRDTRFTHVGIGVEVDARGRLWVTQVFRRPSTTAVPAQAIPVVGDWNGNGRDAPGWFFRGRWYLRNANSTGPSWRVVRFGTTGDVPVVGDWNGDGRDTIGVRRGDRWLLRDTNTTGRADRDVRFGPTGWQPVVGDWNRDGHDGPGVTSGLFGWRQRDRATAGRFDRSFTYGG